MVAHWRAWRFLLRKRFAAKIWFNRKSEAGWINQNVSHRRYFGTGINKVNHIRRMVSWKDSNALLFPPNSFLTLECVLLSFDYNHSSLHEINLYISRYRAKSRKLESKHFEEIIKQRKSLVRQCIPNFFRSRCFFRNEKKRKKWINVA